MGDRGGYYYGHGRNSPFASSLHVDPMRNLSGHFEYLGSDDYEPQTRSPARPSFSTQEYPELDDNDPNAPDRIHCRYLHHNFPVDFPAYSVNEEKTTVEDLRKKIASRLSYLDSRVSVSPAQVRLIYKGKDLNHNSAPLKKYKMKQNSEVHVIVTERPKDYYGDSNSDSGSERDGRNSSNPNPNRLQRPRAHSSVRLRSNENIPVMEPRGSTGSFLSPNGHIPAAPTDRNHRHSLRADHVYSGRDRDRDDHYRGREREPSRDPARRQREPSPAGRRAPSPAPASRRAPSPNPTTRRAPSPLPTQRRGASPAPPQKRATPPLADPNSPLGKVQALKSVFYTQWLPPATKFLVSPPSDPTAREKEFLRLSESIMSKVVLAADNIETEGNVDARNERKSMINEAQNILKSLDAARKP